MKKILIVLKNGFLALLQGKLLQKLQVEKYFPHIMVVLILAWAMVLVSILVEGTLTKVEKGRQELETMRIYHAQKTVEVVSLNRIRSMEDLLERNGSDLTLPVKPADVIER